MLASCGQRAPRRAPSRCSRECLVASGNRTMGSSWPGPDWTGVSYRVCSTVCDTKDHMPVSSPFVIVLSDPERRELSRRACSTRTPYRDRIRARIVLAAGDGEANAAIARQVGVGVDTVRKWRRRFVTGRLAGLRDAPRPGRPRRLPDAVRAQVIAMACELPATSGVPLSRWSSPELARELAARSQVRVSASTVGRWLAEDALKPWQYRSWISIRDPDFAVKAARVLDLYAGVWDGQPLGPK